ncbi:ABC transporter substrate-binding protein [Arthrobacter sp. GMC3]|uniref:ABC transporter substrate-binding protein n=1 Tax=Arthrobacter sp. GMC3 TaxID=2058894 RepID=UPI000CE4E418|nr:ABC transporter substrate-binding protein [Arthrobacter sp. GMC3]
MSTFGMRAQGAPKRRLAAIALIAVLALSACASGSTTAGQAVDAVAAGQAESGAFPVTVKHALGEVTITEEPERIAVIGWTTPDIVVALGRVPVAVGKNSYGADDAGYFPWFREGVQELGGQLPLALPSLERGEIDFEKLLDTAPDLILATYSGITAEDYTRLSAIAPTVAYPETAWATPLEDNIKIVGKALGVPERSKKLQASLNATISSAAQDHPEFKDVTFAYGTIPSDDGTVLFNGPADTRVQLLEQLGMVLAPGISELAAASRESSSFNVSLEDMSDLTPGVFVTNVEDGAQWKKALASSSIFASWGPIDRGAVVVTSDHAQTMSLVSPSPLSIPWGLTSFVGPLSDAIGKLR